MRPLFACLFAATLLASCDFGNWGLGNAYQRTVSWEYDGVRYEMEVKVPAALYSYYDSIPKHGMSYDRYVWESPEYPYLRDICDALYMKVEGRGMSEAELASYVVSFVQSLGYVPDPEGSDYVRFPILTILDGGDCEDAAIAAAALLETMGIPSILVLVPGHMFAAVRCRGCTGYAYLYRMRRYYVAECTSPTPIGELDPESDSARTVTMIAVRRPAYYERPHESRRVRHGRGSLTPPGGSD